MSEVNLPEKRSEKDEQKSSRAQRALGILGASVAAGMAVGVGATVAEGAVSYKYYEWLVKNDAPITEIEGGVLPNNTLSVEQVPLGDTGATIPNPLTWQFNGLGRSLEPTGDYVTEEDSSTATFTGSLYSKENTREVTSAIHDVLSSVGPSGKVRTVHISVEAGSGQEQLVEEWAADIASMFEDAAIAQPPISSENFIISVKQKSPVDSDEDRLDTLQDPLANKVSIKATSEKPEYEPVNKLVRNGYNSGGNPYFTGACLFSAAAFGVGSIAGIVTAGKNKRRQ